MDYGLYISGEVDDTDYFHTIWLFLIYHVHSLHAWRHLVHVISDKAEGLKTAYEFTDVKRPIISFKDFSGLIPNQSIINPINKPRQNFNANVHFW